MSWKCKIFGHDYVAIDAEGYHCIKDRVLGNYKASYREEPMCYKRVCIRDDCDYILDEIRDRENEVLFEKNNAKERLDIAKTKYDKITEQINIDTLE